MKYDLEDRTLKFAKNVRELIRNLDKDSLNSDDMSQLVRSSGSIGANYIEANESLGNKDFVMRLKIARKEAKETIYWMRILEIDDSLLNEAMEIKNILSAIINKVTN